MRKQDYASRDYYDSWLPQLAPSAALVGWFKHRGTDLDKDWETFAKRYRAEMTAPEARHLLEALAKLSRHANFSVGCYCEDAGRCHRSILEALLREHGAEIAGP